MKNKAYHSIRLSKVEIIHGPVVVSFDENENMIEWHYLKSEEPMTEWIGGTYNTIRD